MDAAAHPPPHLHWERSKPRACSAMHPPYPLAGAVAGGRLSPLPDGLLQPGQAPRWAQRGEAQQKEGHSRGKQTLLWAARTHLS